MLPIYNDGGFVFEEIEMAENLAVAETTAQYKFYIKNEAAKTLLDDAINAGEEVKIQVHVTWTAEGEGKYKDFELGADMLAKYVANWDTKMIILTINDTTGIADLECTAQVVSHGVTVEA